jgi:hypothetical protein
MSTLTYTQTLGGKGVAQGLPLRRASQLYDTAHDTPYPTAFSMGLDSDLHAYDRGIYLRVPHLPVTFVIEPYINNHKVNGGTFTRRQFYVIKRGQPLMASTKREATIALFDGAGVVQTRTYANPKDFERDATIAGYSADSGTTVITVETFEGLVDDGSKYDADGTPNGAGLYVRNDFQTVYTQNDDANDKIATGGVNQYAVVEDALFGSTDQVKYTEIDAGVFFFGAAARSEGFVYPSNGGTPRTVFFNEVDREAGVTLPVGDSNEQRIVTPLGNTTDVTLANKANWVNSAVVLPVRPTIGFAHTDLEQATSHQFHQFSTGTDVHSPARKARQQVPFVNIVKLKAIMDAKAPGVAFDFTDLREGRSGVKVGLYANTDASGDAIDVEVQNLYSFLGAEDSGYANLYYNFAAPFVVATRDIRIKDKIVPDLFGNFTLAGEVAIAADSNAFQTLATANDAGNTAGLNLANEKAAAAAIQADHLCGRVLNIYDTPRRMSLLDLEVNPIFQSRIIDGAGRNAMNEANRRVRGADNAGMEPILSDFILMLLGGSSYDWASQMFPRYGGLPQDLAKVIEDIVIEGAVGLVEIAADAII